MTPMQCYLIYKIGDDMNIYKFYKNSISMFILAALTIYVSPVHAHLKWFTDDSQKQTYVYNDVMAYSLAWIGIGIVLILIGIIIDRVLPKISASWQPGDIEKYSTSIFGIFIGISLITSTLEGNLFSMNINDAGVLHTVLLLCEGFIGVSLVFGLAVRQASIFLIALWLVVTQAAGVVVTVENLWILGAAIFLLLRGRPLLRYSQEDIFSFLDARINQAQALTFLRVFLGANLIFLGFSEKILVPELGMAFLQDHPWNFMGQLGLTWFSDGLFVFSAGAVEIILGIFLMAGWVVRLTAAVLATFFLIPPFFMGPAELIGHIPHISIVIMLLLFGRGYTFHAAFTALVTMLKHVKTSRQVVSADTVQSQKMERAIEGQLSCPLLLNMHGEGVCQKTEFSSVRPKTHDTLSSLVGYGMRNRYQRTVGVGKNTDLYHRAARVAKQHCGISRLAKSRYHPLAAGRQRG